MWRDYFYSFHSGIQRFDNKNIIEFIFKFLQYKPKSVILQVVRSSVVAFDHRIWYVGVHLRSTSENRRSQGKILEQFD